MGESYREEVIILGLDSEEWLLRGGRRRLMIEMNAISFLFDTTFTSEFYPVDR
jgi:hypothetical protein